MLCRCSSQKEIFFRASPGQRPVEKSETGLESSLVMKLKLKAGQFYGVTSQSLAANGFRFTEKSYQSHARLPTHAHELSHFCFVLAGNYSEKIGGKSFERSPAALVYYPPDVSHGEEHFTDGRHLLVEVDFRSLETVEDYGVRLCNPMLLDTSLSLWLANRMYKEFSERDEFSPVALESISTELLIATARKDKLKAERNPPPWLGRLKEFLRENFSEPPGLNELAKAVDVHPTHLARVFRQFERCTVGDFIREVRIDYARKRLLGSNAPLVEIALDAGFADHTHFTRSFKRVTGMTPTEFRRLFGPR
jgi:AraC family transcriptional regulator